MHIQNHIRIYTFFSFKWTFEKLHVCVSHLRGSNVEKKTEERESPKSIEFVTIVQLHSIYRALIIQLFFCIFHCKVIFNYIILHY